MEAKKRTVLSYKTASQRFPFREWRDSFGSDEEMEAQIDGRVAGLEGGNFGKHRSVDKGVIETKINYGPGYRIYFGVNGDELILLCAGDKSTQTEDIKSAHKYWKDYKERQQLWIDQQKNTGENS